MKPSAFIFGLLFLFAFFPMRGFAQQSDGERIVRLESRVSNLEQRILYHRDEGVALVLFGAFCALWAQNTRRNPWLWFFLGMFFSVITVLVLLKMNTDDKEPKP